jgi:aminoglycoside phosphotransferase (APT) family kinase protein
MGLMEALLPKVQAYLNEQDWREVPWLRGRSFAVAALAQGEYNLNYQITAGDLDLVFRINVGTQIQREDQIVYEYQALSLLEGSGVTPRPYFVDDSRRFFDTGILIMEFLPGEPLDYRRDTASAAKLFARIHQTAVPDNDNHLIREAAPLSLIWEECAGLLQRYFISERADATIRDYLQDLLRWADAARSGERYYQTDPWPCIVNTEVNSGNFIVNRSRGTIHLVDWEMPRWGDPSQDLAHFCSPLTTLWKTDYRMDRQARREFLDAYCCAIRDRHLKDTLMERIRLREPFVRLRGISWSAMGWAAYQSDYAGVKNPDTWAKLNQYMNLGFIRSLFDPFLKPKGSCGIWAE